MRLLITTPLAIVVDTTNVSYLRAEDETGSFGILPGHADFLTTLAISVITWRNDGTEHHVAVRGGVLSVRDGDQISIVTRQAVAEETLTRLGVAVLGQMRKAQELEAATRLSGTRLELAAMRQIQRYLATSSGRLSRSEASMSAALRETDELTQGNLE